MVKVFDSEGAIVFSRKFSIYEDTLSVGLTIRRSRDLETVQQKQNVEFLLITKLKFYKTLNVI